MQADLIKKWMDLFASYVEDNKDYLSELDTPIGDGDHGGNMARGTQAMLEALEEKQPQTMQESFKVIAMALLSKVGGASGPLYGSAFMGMASKSEADSIYEIILAGFENIKKRGKAEPGEKTMLDTWNQVLESLEKEELKQANIIGFAEATKDLKASKGRASYLGDRSIGHIDPGAMSSAYLFKSMVEAGVLDE